MPTRSPAALQRTFIALALLTISFAAPAHAQSNKQIISGTWYEDRATNSGFGNLVLTFAQTPANQFLNVTNVSCWVDLTSSQVMTFLNLEAGTTSGQNDLGRSLSVRGTAIPETIGALKYYSIVQNGIFYKFGPGRFPSIEIDTATTGSNSVQASCVIIGNLTDN
jgi:hypothetical protein